MEKSTIDCSSDCKHIATTLLQQAEQDLVSFKVDGIVSSEMRIKIKCKVLNKINIAVSMLAKSKTASEDDQALVIKVCKQLEEDEKHTN